jgi:diphthamide synthase subunit DPH2
LPENRLADACLLSDEQRRFECLDLVATTACGRLATDWGNAI